MQGSYPVLDAVLDYLVYYATASEWIIGEKSHINPKMHFLSHKDAVYIVQLIVYLARHDISSPRNKSLVCIYYINLSRISKLVF